MTTVSNPAAAGPYPTRKRSDRQGATLASSSHWDQVVPTNQFPAPRAAAAPAPLRGRTVSLRSILWVGVSLSLLLGIGSFGVVVQRVVALTDARAEARTRLHAGTNAAHERLAAVVTQERELRTFHTDGDPARMLAFEQSRQREAELHAVVAAAFVGAPAEIVESLADLDRALTAWRTALLIQDPAAEPRMAEVTRRHAAAIAQLRALEQRTYYGYDDRIRVTIGAALALIVLAGAFAVTMVVWVLRRTAQPLEEISRLAASGAAFPAPVLTGVREVDALAAALHELDVAVRDREDRIAEAHAAAVELTRFGERVQQVIDEGELHEALGDRLRAVSGADACVALVLEHDGARLAVARNELIVGERLQLPIMAEPMRCRALRTLRVVTEQVGSSAACRCPLAEVGASYLCAPMQAAGSTVGVIALQAAASDAFGAAVQRRVQASLGFGAPALASLRLLAATRERALRDPLTGAYNRAYLADYLDSRLALAQMHGEGLGLLMIDLDHFKKLNDTHGHAVGDRALIAAVAALQGEVRGGDAVVRQGGEELVVALLDTRLAGAAETAERLRRAIEAIKLSSEHGPVLVRASIGVATFPEHGADRTSLLDAADRALYRAKAAGRNRVMTATPAAPAAPVEPVEPAEGDAAPPAVARPVPIAN